MEKNHDKKGFTLVEIMIVVVIIGLLAALAVPTFRAIQASGRENTIRNNLRQVAAAGQQYLLDKGFTQVGYGELTAGPIPYLKQVENVNGEDYSLITVTDGGGPISVVAESTLVGINGTVSFTY